MKLIRILVTIVLQAFATSAFGDTTSESAAQSAGQNVGDSGALYSLVLSLVLILGAAAAATFFLRRWKGSIGRSSGPLQLIHVIGLGPRERLALVKVGEKYLIVGITPTSVTKISEVDKLDESDTSGSGTATVQPRDPVAN